jgi:hypothetical protein
MAGADEILGAHVPDPLNMCAGCRAWWGRMAPYPCTQVEWALLVSAHLMTEEFLADLRRDGVGVRGGGASAAVRQRA